MSKTLEFKVFCFEAYRAEKKLSGKEAMKLFKQYGVLDYLNACFDVLHSAGRDYIIEDIDIFIDPNDESYKIDDEEKLEWSGAEIYKCIEFDESGYHNIEYEFYNPEYYFSYHGFIPLDDQAEHCK